MASAVCSSSYLDGLQWRSAGCLQSIYFSLAGQHPWRALAFQDIFYALLRADLIWQLIRVQSDTLPNSRPHCGAPSICRLDVWSSLLLRKVLLPPPPSPRAPYGRAGLRRGALGEHGHRHKASTQGIGVFKAGFSNGTLNFFTQHYNIHLQDEQYGSRAAYFSN